MRTNATSADRAIRWSRGLPTQPGWYWYRNPSVGSCPKEGRPIRVSLDRWERPQAEGQLLLPGHFFHNCKALFAGPIQPPKEES